MDSKPVKLDINQRFVQHMRRSIRSECKTVPDRELQSSHQERPSVSEPAHATAGKPQVPDSALPFRRESSPKRQVLGPVDLIDPASEERKPRKLKSPNRPPPPPYIPGDYEPVPRKRGKMLWHDGRPGTQPPSHSYRRGPPPQYPASSAADDIPDIHVHSMIPQPETRPITQEQLVAEVKGIYAGLVMVESKCIEVDNAQNAQNSADSAPLNKEQWQALIALHRTLLHEHHDFFLASQHPAASDALRRLANKYAMPTRMWRHGIHSFLELLRHRLPEALKYMQTFIYLAYSMMALLYETVPAFEDTWIECLGDLSRYRMAIEDDDFRDREVWTSVSRHWYSKATDKASTTGRLHHHLSILASHNAVAQLSYYLRSLCVAASFSSARESILTLLETLTDDDPFKLRQGSARKSWKGLDKFTEELEKLMEELEKFMEELDPPTVDRTEVNLEEKNESYESTLVPMFHGTETLSDDIFPRLINDHLSSPLGHLEKRRLVRDLKDDWEDFPLQGRFAAVNPGASSAHGAHFALVGGSGFSDLSSNPPFYGGSLLSLSSFFRSRRPRSGKCTKITLTLLAFASAVNVAYALGPPACNAQCGAWIGAGLATATNYFAVQLSTPSPSNSANWLEATAMVVAFVPAVLSVGMFGSALRIPAPAAGRGQQDLYYLLDFMFTVVCFLAVAAMPSSAHPIISYTPTLIVIPAAVLFLLWNSIRPSTEGAAPQNEP